MTFVMEVTAPVEVAAAGKILIIVTPRESSNTGRGISDMGAYKLCIGGGMYFTIKNSFCPCILLWTSVVVFVVNW